MLISLYYEYGVKHNDMKYNNIVYKKIDNEYKFVFIDFSFSYVLKNIQKTSENCSVFVENIYYDKFLNLFFDDTDEDADFQNIKQFRNWLGDSFSQYILLKSSIGCTDDMKSLYLDMCRIMSKKSIDAKIFENLFKT
jgi:hypothetical protein